jgi:coenzyme F420-0:L-glutamate ligase/coenzyme F420-1:gamma-L-glutamate ligase
MPESRRLEILPVPGLPEVAAGDDLVALVVDALARCAVAPADGDVLVVSSKIVSKAEGRAVTATTRDDAIGDQTRRVVAERIGPRGITRIVESRSGPVLAAAGVDASNVPPGTVLLLPADPDASARRLRAGFRAATGVRLGVVVSDTAGRPWRDGQVDLAVGAAGVQVTEDLRGGTDTFDTPLEVTVRALADELASAADLVKGKLTGTPVAVVRGLADLVTQDDGPGAAALLRVGGSDWFALGHVEAVRAALGVPPGTEGVPLQPMYPGDAGERLSRALAVATAAPDELGRLPSLTTQVTAQSPRSAHLTVVPAVAGDGPLRSAEAMALGAFTQRLLVAAWAEGLAATCTVDDHDRVTVIARVSPGDRAP